MVNSPRTGSCLTVRGKGCPPGYERKCSGRLQPSMWKPKGFDTSVCYKKKADQSTRRSLEIADDLRQWLCDKSEVLQFAQDRSSHATGNRIFRIEIEILARS